MYHLIFFILLLFTVIEQRRKINIFFSRIIFILLFLFVSLRYGQGTDYFSYISLFYDSANAFEYGLQTNNWSLTNEFGFSAITFFWIKIIRQSPELLSGCFSALSFILIWKFIKKFSDLPITSLFIFYCTFYLVYPFSGIRQSVTISIFVLYLAPLLHKKKFLKYYLYSTLLFFIHYSSIVLFIIPIVNVMKNFKKSHIYLLSFISLIIGFTLYSTLFSVFAQLDYIASRVSIYSKEAAIDFRSILLRIFIFIPILQTYKVFEKNSIKNLFLRIYILGFWIYLIFMTSTAISSRLNVYMRYFEIILLADLLLLVFYKRTYRALALSYILTIYSVVYVKNINSFIKQGNYMNNVTFTNYPYISVFNKAKINNVRNVPYYYHKHLP